MARNRVRSGRACLKPNAPDDLSQKPIRENACQTHFRVGLFGQALSKPQFAPAPAPLSANLMLRPATSRHRLQATLVPILHDQPAQKIIGRDALTQ